MTFDERLLLMVLAALYQPVDNHRCRRMWEAVARLFKLDRDDALRLCQRFRFNPNQRVSKRSATPGD
jgi:hypothetical protein